MRLFSKIFSLCLAIALLLSLSGFAYAAENRDYMADYNDWPTTFSNFTMISRNQNGGSWNGYTCALQRFLGTYCTDFRDVLDSNGSPDGLFGPVTQQAVFDYQGMKLLSADGVVGPNTWSAIGGDVYPQRNKEYTYFWSNDSNYRVFMALESNYSFKFYFYTNPGGTLSVISFT